MIMLDKGSNSARQVSEGHTVEVTIKVRPLWAILPASVAEHAKSFLTFRSAEYAESGDGKLAARTRDLHFYYEDEHGQLVIPPGLVPRVVRQFIASGYKTRVVQTVNWAAAVDHSLLASLAASPWDKRLISALANNPRGQLVYHSEEERLELLDIILRVFPQHGVLITAKNKKTCQKLLKQLTKRSSRKVDGDVDEAWRTRPATLIGTRYLATLVADTDVFQLVVFADEQTTASMASEATQDPLWELPDLRIFGLLSSNSQLDASQRFELEARFGPVIPDSAPRACLPEVTVYSVGPFAYPPPDDSLNHLERKRRYIWHNTRRNAEIARIATLCVADDQAFLRQYGQREESLNSNEEQSTSPSSVAVVTESPEHARAIRKLLPQWDILDGRDGDVANKAETPLRPGKAIVTCTRACRDGLAVDVLLRADGTGARHQDSFGPHVWLNRCPMGIIDFTDDFDERARSDMVSRHRDYAERDFTIAGTERI